MATPTSWSETIWANSSSKTTGPGRFKEDWPCPRAGLRRRGNVHGTMGVECGDCEQRRSARSVHDLLSAAVATLYQSQARRCLEDVDPVERSWHRYLPPRSPGDRHDRLRQRQHRDLFIACGHLIDNVEHRRHARVTTSAISSSEQRQGPIHQRFRPVRQTACRRSSAIAGAAFDDLDNDGDIDVVILNSRQSAHNHPQDASTAW